MPTNDRDPAASQPINGIRQVTSSAACSVAWTTISPPMCEALAIHVVAQSALTLILLGAITYHCKSFWPFFRKTNLGSDQADFFVYQHQISSNLGIGKAAKAAYTEAIFHKCPWRISIFLLKISIDRLMRMLREMNTCRLSCWHGGNVSRMAWLRRAKSHLVG